MSIFRSLNVTALNFRAGKYWHRHRRPRPVTYNSSLEYHKGLLRAEEQQKSAAKRKRPVAVVEEKHQPVDDDVEMDTPGPSKPKSLPETPAPLIDTAPDRAMSPVSTASTRRKLMRWKIRAFSFYLTRQTREVRHSGFGVRE